jgi:hypothetical protein
MKSANFIFVFAIVLFGLNSCGTEEKKEEAKDKKEDLQEEADTVVTEVEDTIVEIEAVETLEGYAAFKTYDLAQEYFADSNMNTDTTWYAEGTEMYLVSHCIDPLNGNRVNLVWEQGGKEKLAFVEISSHYLDKESNTTKTQKIKTSCGIYTGMTLKQLQEFCGGEEIQFAGFGWDYSGGVMIDYTKKLVECNVNIILDMEASEYEKSNDLLGDIIFKSTDEKVQNVNIYVQKLTYYL